MVEVADRPGGRNRRRFGVLGAVLGAAAAGVAAGIAAERTLVRRMRERADDPYGREPFGRLPCDESLTVTTDDGVDLHVEVVDPADGVEFDAGFAAAIAGGAVAPDPTVVFVHGFCLDMGSFHFQRKELTRRGDWRAVFYDQPGHGRSGRLRTGDYELTAQADALRAVVDATTPTGPVVLVGHSMGGMAVMALAERHPDLFERVAGTVLIATSAGRGEGDASGLPELITRIARPLLPLADGATRVSGGIIDRARRAGTDVAWLLTRRYGFAADRPSPALVSFVERTISATPVDTIVRHLRTLHHHTDGAHSATAEYGQGAAPTLAALRGKPVLLICGDCDPITPRSRSEAIRTLLPDAELVVVPDSGHLVLLEHPDEVNAALRAFLEKIG
jgi:pimeloyl-ACP methyl ester carboxylesterase